MPITSEAYLAMCKHRFGVANPERISNPVWEWMVREKHNPYSARESIGLEREYGSCSLERNPDWCFQRMGVAQVEMPDGRRISIAGEHEDFYDPDFCIYNDVVVERGGDVEIFAYPRSLFPPTDFHAATLIEKTIWILGSLGYPEERGGPDTPVFTLDTSSYRIHKESPTGQSPGWIHDHKARLLDDEFTIEVRGGQLILRNGEQEHRRMNTDVFQLNTRTGVWSKMTDTSSWRQFRIRYNEELRMAPPFPSLGWYTGEVLQGLGYPLEVAPEPGEDDSHGDRVHTLLVENVPVRIVDRYRELRVNVEGVLPPALVQSLLKRLQELLESTDRTECVVTEC